MLYRLKSMPPAPVSADHPGDPGISIATDAQLKKSGKGTVRRNGENGVNEIWDVPLFDPQNTAFLAQK